MEKNKDIVTIDGPSGAGKSTVARALARRLGWRYLDTGAMYRAATAAALDAGIGLQPPDEEALDALLEAAGIALDGEGRVLLAGKPVEDRRLREERVNRAVSAVAALGRVRDRMRALQRAFAGRGGGLVAEGRDLGSVVFPEAAYKFYLDASPEERARRRALERRRNAGEDVTPEQVLAEQAERDRRDAGRARAPLRMSEDMIRVDTTGLTVEEVVDRLAAMIRS